MIYILKRISGATYEEYDAKVVRAPNEQEARRIANENTGCEGQLWSDPLRVTCLEIDPLGESGEILGSFNAG